MYIAIFIVLCFCSGILGIIAFISKEDNSADRLREDQRAWEMEQRKHFSDIKSEVISAKESCAETFNNLNSKLKSADVVNETLSVEIISVKGLAERADHRAKAASELAHRALIESSQQKSIKLDGSLKLEHSKPKSKRSP